jgi:TetR/AcrR family transcriptional repressor of mexJK operon
LEIDNRKEQIIKAALKRFSHFGIGKTTMNEIAEDSSISKGNIYYYFPDKNALITEVIKDLLGQFDILVQERIANCSSTLETLEEIQNAKNDFFEKHYMLHIFEGIDCSSGNENTRHLAELASKYANKLIVEIFEKGIKRKEFKPFNVEEIAELYIQASKGIFLVNKDQSVKKITLDKQLRDSIHHKQMELAKIFIKALSNH